MKQYITNKANHVRLLSIVLTASLFTVFSCTDEYEKADKNHNFSMEMSTRAGETVAELMPSMRLFTFYEGTPNDKKFREEVLNITWSNDKLTAQVEVGKWNMAMVSNPNGGTIIKPTTANVMSKLPLYKYEPTVSNGKSSDAHEIYLENKLTPDITSGGSHTMSAQLNRTVAKVELIIRKTTPNFKLSAAGGNHTIKLHNIPSTISYSGDLLPNKTAPDTLAAPLQAPIILEDAGNGSYKASTITFIIPAHRGDAYASANPIDTTLLKMNVTVDLERSGGSRFEKQVQIEKVAQCNRILRVYIDVNDGIEFNTEILNWEGVDVNSTVGKGYQNWLYVKKGATGNGLSWSDALPDINTAITKAQALTAATKKVNGILVAGGETLAYNESLNIPADIKIYGGWKGESGTELASTANSNDVYASVNRNLAIYKVRLSAGTGKVSLATNNSVLDGFIISGTGSGNSLVEVTNASAWLNAVEIDQQTSIATTYALSISNGVGTNILVSRNNKGVSVTGNGKLVNATIANNTASSVFSGILVNSIYWSNNGTVVTTGTINYCAFEGMNIPTGTNYPINTVNNAWFTSANIPGPHFNQTVNTSVPYYAVSTLTPNRAPQLGRGDQTSFDEVTVLMLDANKQDINGNPRHHNGTDIGCYESTAAQKGFEFRWNMKDIYISPKVEIESDHLALLFDNSENIYVEWVVEDFQIISNRYSVVSGTTSGSGNTKNLGSFKLKSGSTVNTSFADLNCGSLVLKCTNIDKSYFPNVPMTVYQSPAIPKVWTAGYAGSFHRWNETGPRYVFGTNSGDWTARIISGHDWIKIDGESRPTVPDADTEVEETFGGAVTGKGNIIFRVGMKSTLPSPTSNPRYGLISITRTVGGETGVALFFVRQGEKADYLYLPTDKRDAYNKNKSRHETGREYASKFAVFNMTDPNGRFDASGVLLPKKGGGFVDYPSKTGYYFKWNDLKAYYPDNSISGTDIGNTNTSSYWANTDFNDDREICPPGYHTPTDPEWVHSYFLNRVTANFDTFSGTEGADGTTFVWGRLADGYFDKYAGYGDREVGTGPDRATEGLLMYNDFNNASVFFPTATRRTTGSSIEGGTNKIAWYFTASPKGSNSDGNRYKNNTNVAWGTHSYGTGATGHLGMSCTPLYKYNAASIRCVSDEK